ncbi:unnamed protein product [Caretta caretta]
MADESSTERMAEYLNRTCTAGDLILHHEAKTCSPYSKEKTHRFLDNEESEHDLACVVVPAADIADAYRKSV